MVSQEYNLEWIEDSWRDATELLTSTKRAKYNNIQKTDKSLTYVQNGNSKSITKYKVVKAISEGWKDGQLFKRENKAVIRT